MPEKSAMRLFLNYLWAGVASRQLAQLGIFVFLHGDDPGGFGFLVRREKIIGINLSTPE